MCFSIGMYQNLIFHCKFLVASCLHMKPSRRVDRPVLSPERLRLIPATHGFGIGLGRMIPSFLIKADEFLSENIHQITCRLIWVSRSHANKSHSLIWFHSKNQCWGPKITSGLRATSPLSGARNKIHSGTHRKEIFFSIGIYQNRTLQSKSVVTRCPLMKPRSRVRSGQLLGHTPEYRGESHIREHSNIPDLVEEIFQQNMTFRH